MGLSEAIRKAMETRGIQPAQAAERIGERRDRTTFYRILKGDIKEPRITTLVAICRVLQVTPNEILEMADLWPFRPRATDALDLRLRATFAQVQALPADRKEIAVRQIEALTMILSGAVSLSNAAHVIDGL